MDLAIAEEFIDAFYSFDSARLEAILESAKDSIPSIVYYQGWAKGGNYEIVDRMPCVVTEGQVSCSITVEDDHMRALGIDFDVTDTFHLSFSEGKVVSVETSSNDLDVYRDARNWVRAEQPELVREACAGFFDGGPSPDKCAEAMAQGYAAFAASSDFPDAYR